jgi:FixJ family two-component response regulator
VTRDQVLEAVISGGTARDVAVRLGTTNRTVVPILNEARADGFVKRMVGEDAVARWRRL